MSKLAAFAAIRRASSRVSSFVAMSALPPKANVSQRDWATRYFGSQIRHMIGIRRFLIWGRPMSALALSCLIFVLTLGGILLGTLLRRALPEHHLSKDSQDVVRLGTGLIGTIAALVLGLLIAAAKSSFDTQSTQITQITADIILLDNLLAQYGPEARPIREQMRSIIGPVADQIWREKQASTAAPFEFNATGEKAYLAIQALSPQNDLQRSLQTRAGQLSTDLVQTRLILFAESGNVIPTPWLVIIFASFSLFSELNVTVFTCLSLFALSASCAIFLILELSQPFSGLMMISSGPLRHALAPL
jgi:hypothetical protein